MAVHHGDGSKNAHSCQRHRFDAFRQRAADLAAEVVRRKEHVAAVGAAPAEENRRVLLELLLLEKALHEAAAELAVGSERLVVPLRGILRLMNESNGSPGVA